MRTPTGPAAAGPFRTSFRIRGRGWLAALLLAVPVIVAGLFPAGASAAGTSRQAPAARPAYCQSGGPKLWDDLATCGWPGKPNTGPRLSDCPDHKLVVRGDGHTQFVLSKADEEITCTDFRGTVIIKAAHVTITNSEVQTKHGTGAGGSASVTVDAGAGATITHVTVDGGNSVHACIWHQGSHLMVKDVNCFGVNDGIFSWALTSKPSSGGDNFTIADSYFHDFTKATANGHDDGFQTEGSSHGLVVHDTFRMTPDSTSAVAIWDSRNNSNDITVRHNLMTGGGFAVYAEDYNPGDSGPGNPSAVGGFHVTNIQFDDNSFSTFAAGCVGKYGVWFTRPAWMPYQGGPTDGWHRAGNVVLETGEDIDNGNPHDNGRLCA